MHPPRSRSTCTNMCTTNAHHTCSRTRAHTDTHLGGIEAHLGELSAQCSVVGHCCRQKPCPSGPAPAHAHSDRAPADTAACDGTAARSCTDVAAAGAPGGAACKPNGAGLSGTSQSRVAVALFAASQKKRSFWLWCAPLLLVDTAW